MIVRYFVVFWLVAASAPAGFIDATADSKIGFAFDADKSPAKYLIEAMVGGVAMFDADGDGKLDLYFVNGGAMKRDPRFWNRLYSNQGDGTFLNITETAGLRGHGYGQGVPSKTAITMGGRSFL